MGKNKRLKLSNAPKRPLKPQSLKPKTSTTRPPLTATTTPAKHRQLQHSKPVIPFSPTDTILLVGEGDLSFTSSLITSYHFPATTLYPTVLETSHEALVEKYPHAEECIKAIEEGGGRVRYGIDATKMKGQLRELMIREGRGWRGRVDRVVFNFPHVGGKSKDVNRQARYNQEMLVQFFENTIPLLSPRPGSSIIVTLFEGEPYTLWNIRDLARHSGLQVQQSFRFQAGAYPGYKHARTLGVVKSKKGTGEVSGGAWKGEDRESRSYVFVRKGEENIEVGGKGNGKEVGKRKRANDSGSDDSDSEDEEAGKGRGKRRMSDEVEGAGFGNAEGIEDDD